MIPLIPDPLGGLLSELTLHGVIGSSGSMQSTPSHSLSRGHFGGEVLISAFLEFEIFHLPFRQPCVPRRDSVQPVPHRGAHLGVCLPEGVTWSAEAQSCRELSHFGGRRRFTLS